METITGKTSQAIQDETLLIRRILDGHTELFRQLAGRYAGQVLRMVASLIPSQEEAEEVTQDALLEAFQSLARFDARQASFQTWLMRIAYHTALKHYRQHHKTITVVEVEQCRLDTIPNDETDILLDDTSTDRVILMERAIDTLKPDDQRCRGTGDTSLSAHGVAVHFLAGKTFLLISSCCPKTFVTLRT